MKRKHESDDEIDAEVHCSNADEFRDQLLEEDEFVRVIKCELIITELFTMYCCNYYFRYLLDSSISSKLFFLEVQ